MHDRIGNGRLGSWLVAGIVAVAAALAAFALWFQWQQTRRCLAVYGPEAAGHIQSADRVELWELDPQVAIGRIEPLERRDISAAKGLVHLRRGLVEDANFAWTNDPVAHASTRSWRAAIAFIPTAAGDGDGTVLLLDLDGSPGVIGIAGRPGELRLGRIGPGLRKWLAEALDQGGP